MNRHSVRECASAAAALIFGVLVLTVPQAAADGFADGTALCLRSVLPALFPFFVVCELLLAAPLPAALLHPLQKMLGLESARTAQAVLLSWVGGYAVCARLAGQLYREHRIAKRDAVLLQLYGCCSGPGFVVGCVGGLLLGNVRLGVLLYAAQLAANLAAVGVLFAAGQFRALPPDRLDSAPGESPAPQVGDLPRAIQSAIQSALSVCGCVVFFRIVWAVARAVLPLPPTVVSALLEISAGCADFSALGGQAALYGCCACLSILGLSVWAQIRLFAGEAFCPRLLLRSRLLHGLFLQGFLRLLVRFLPGSAAVCSTLSARVVPILRLPPDAAALGFVFLCAALYKARQNLYNVE